MSRCKTQFVNLPPLEMFFFFIITMLFIYSFYALDLTLLITRRIIYMENKEYHSIFYDTTELSDCLVTVDGRV